MSFVATPCSCLACGELFPHGKKLTHHVKHVHGLSSEEYAIKHVHSSTKPTCPECGSDTRFVSITHGFKQYCKEHSKLAESLAGSVGGKQKKTWNKGHTKYTDDRVKKLAEKLSGEGNPFFGKQHSVETIEVLSSTRTLTVDEFLARVSTRSNEFTLVTDPSEYVSRQRQYIVFKCVACGEEQRKTLQAFERGSRCYRCHPESKSNTELEVYDFVRTVCPDAISGDRKTIAPKELDVFVPSKNFAVELHGLYWHSDNALDEAFDKRYHLKKFELAVAKGITLVQLFLDEWRDKRTICESMLLHRLSCDETIVGARKCELVEMTTVQQREFFSLTHIAGYVPSTCSLGLVYNGEIVSALSLRKPRNSDKYSDSLEVARFSTRHRTNVQGGLSRLVSAASKRCHELDADKLVTYVDRRFGTGKGYEACGFERVGDTGVDYWYTDNVVRHDRFKFRAQDGKSEKIVASEAGVSRIYGCGSLVLVKKV